MSSYATARAVFGLNPKVRINDGNVDGEFVCEMKTVIVGDLFAEQAVYDTGEMVLHIAKNSAGCAGAEHIELGSRYTLHGEPEAIRDAMRYVCGIEPADPASFL